jgi:uncharacterized oxidoreductase
MTTTSRRHTVLVTGGAGGLGLAMARLFHERGHRVIVCARTESALEHAASEMPGAVAIRADVSVAADREALMARATAQGLDILVNNAAISRAHDYVNDYTLEVDRADAEIATNLTAPIELTRLFLLSRRVGSRDATPASIVNVGTPGALFPLEAIPLYCVTKAGLRMFTLALRRQLAATPVRVIEVFPPALDTGLARVLDNPHMDANGEEVIAFVAANCVDGILRGDEVVLPHPAAAAMYEQFAPKVEGELLDQINTRVKRRVGWDVAPT